MRALLLTGSLLALAACEPSVPDSGAGVGFGGADAFRQQQSARDAQLTRTIADDQTQASNSKSCSPVLCQHEREAVRTSSPMPCARRTRSGSRSTAAPASPPKIAICATVLTTRAQISLSKRFWLPVGQSATGVALIRMATVSPVAGIPRPSGLSPTDPDLASVAEFRAAPPWVAA